MTRLLIALVLACALSAVSCGDVFVRGAINPGTQSTTGTISIVQFSASPGGGVSVTIITLTGNSVPNTLSFCGDQRSLFPVNQRVQINFTPGQTCATILTVTVI